jgi:hypothetical protein
LRPLLFGWPFLIVAERRLILLALLLTGECREREQAGLRRWCDRACQASVSKSATNQKSESIWSKLGFKLGGDPLDGSALFRCCGSTLAPMQ